MICDHIPSALRYFISEGKKKRPWPWLPRVRDCLILHIYSAELRISQAYIQHDDVSPCK